jgi:DtxR family transcriptional regulator, Mn-dependent transcriptional regulator
MTERAKRRAIGVYTAPVEDYLKAIYELERDGGPAGTNEIAQRLSIAPASVSGMIRRLARQRLLSHERYRGVKLTGTGRRVALRLIRRHRVIEAYLTRALGFSWDRVHDEAERLEHAASDELVDRMAAAIGEPATDPHGAPIPTREGTIAVRPVIALAALALRKRGRVVEVSDDSADRLRYLEELGLTPGARVQLLERAPFGGPLRLKIGAREQLVGAELASTVLVERAD